MYGKHYVLQLDLDGHQYYTLWGEVKWEQDEYEKDRFVLESNWLLMFRDRKEACLAYAQSASIPLEEEENGMHLVLDLDLMQAWVRKPNRRIDCDLFNNIWNCAGDLAATLPTGFEKHDNDKRSLSIYHKLFYGLNLPAITPKGENYTPRLNKWEVLLLRQVMRDAIRGFRDAINAAKV